MAGSTSRSAPEPQPEDDMPRQDRPMTCRECGVEMNHHADKIVNPTSAEEVRQVNPADGGFVEEVHSCPECGCSETRRAE